MPTPPTAEENASSGAHLPPDIRAALTRGDTLLTPNQRAARTLRLASTRTMQAESRTHWTPPTILALDSWLASIWHQLLLTGAETRLLLNRAQTHTLWRAIIAQDTSLPTLRSADSLADLAARAHHLLASHNGRPAKQEFAQSTDTRAFVRWAADFDRRCQRLPALTPAQLPAALEQALAQGTLPLTNAALTLVDFDVLLPAHAQFFDSVESAGYNVNRLQTSVSTTSAHLHAAPDLPAEIQSAAHWARTLLAADPTTHIAIVVPNLAELRPQIERTFARTLAPQSQPITADASTPPYEFSLGLPLAQTPLAASAIALLSWTLHPLPLDHISTLLLSPFVGALHTAETLPAAELDAFELRRTHLLRPQLSLESFLRTLESSPRLPLLRNLRHRLHALHKTPSAAPQAPFSDHADAFRTQLAAAGWTDALTADSLTIQTRRRWESALDELATLDFESARPTPAEALQALTRICTETIFAPESRDAPIQVLGPLELGGLPFDSLWFLGADDLAWPAPIALHPFLPWTAARPLGIPGADPAHDTALARRLTARIASSASAVVFSYAAHAAEGLRRPSALLTSLDLTPLPTAPPAPTPEPLPLDSIPDLTPIAPLPDAPIPGGARVLELQAACPFRAFAEQRLFSTELESSEPGLDPRDRGSIVHKVMEAFWATAADQPTLLRMSPREVESLLDRSITAALAQRTAAANSPWDAAYLEVQRERLRLLLRPWLDFEAARPQFAVLALEEKFTAATIGPLRLDVRVDRIDETEPGRVIIDYKTGPATPSDWLSDRPDAPQLPLYAVLSDSPEAPLAGLAFALLRPGEDLDLKGFADDPLALKSSRTLQTIAEHIANWSATLTRLAEDFAAGEAAVSPKCYPKTCTRCSQRILCRLDPTTLHDFGDDDDPAPGLGSDEGGSADA